MDVTIKDLLEAGVHFGHQTRRWNPKMKPYIFKEQSGIDVRSDKKASARLMDASEMAKIELTTSTTTHVSLPYISADKHFELEIESENDLEMNMTCTEEQQELGLLLGSRYQVRNRERNLLYQEGFCIRIETNKSGSEQIKAQLKIQANHRNREGSWAYYDETEGEWVAVDTAEQNGYLVCETNHFSTWTILIPETDNAIWGFVGVGAVFAGAVIIAVVSIVYKKRK